MKYFSPEVNFIKLNNDVVDQSIEKDNSELPGAGDSFFGG